MSQNMDTRLFSLDEARQTLPLVEPIVEDLLKSHRILKNHQGGGRSGKKKPEDEGGPAEDSAETTVIEHHKNELTSCLEEIYTLGAEFEGFSDTRIHFPSKLENRMVYLCWKPSDHNVSYWHETYADCKDRTSVEGHDFDS